MSKSDAFSQDTLIDSGFFVLRTPLLPVGAINDWGASLSARDAYVNGSHNLAACIEADRNALEAKLRESLLDPVIDQALRLASDSLHAALEAWRTDSTSERGRNAITTLASYLLRMSTRCTPFGICAGNAMGSIAGTTHLALAARSEHRTHSRIDSQNMMSITNALTKHPDVQMRIHFETNASIYEIADQLRYTKTIQTEDRDRRFQLVSVKPTPTLRHVLDRAKHGATPTELAQSVCDLYSDTSLFDNALQFVKQLIDSELLCSTLTPPITGGSAIKYVAERLRTAGGKGESLRETLLDVQHTLEALDRSPLGTPNADVTTLPQRLVHFTSDIDIHKLLHVDLVKSAPAATLGSDVSIEIARAITLMHKICPPKPRQDLKAFCEAFRERYQDREVPLMEALDEDFGVGFDVAPTTQASASSLIAGLALSGQGERKIGWGERQSHLLRLLCQALSSGTHDIALSAMDIDVLSGPSAPLPCALAANVTLVGSTEDIARNDYQIQWHGAFGPSGALYFGRFCEGMPELEAQVRQHLQAEEATRPNAVFAEIVHLPQSRNGNIMSRPQLRHYEIPFLGRSGAPVESQIPLTDLCVSVVRDRIVLRSQRLNREVIPRLTTAHNAPNAELSVYRFLTALQVQNVANWLAWDWGTLQDAPFLPRVTVGRLIISPARWRLTSTDLETLQSRTGTARFETVQKMRECLKLPRWVGVKQEDRVMSIDLDNVIAIDVLAHLARERDTLELVELVATPDGGSLCAHSIEGQFMHELVVPYMLRQPRVPNITRQDRPHAHEQQTQRLFAPGDPWLYAKAYTGSSLINRVFLQYVLPIVASAKAAGHCDQWFFVRFADPHPHLRIRLRAQDPAQRQVLQERLCQALRAAIDDGVMYRFQLDSYDREIERYGGPQAISAVELLFCHDSECAVDLLNTVPTADEDERWTLAMASIDHWLSDLNLSLPARCALLDHMHSNLAREFRSPISLEYELGQRYRLLKPRLEAIMNDAAITLDARDAAIRDALSSRSTRTANPVRALQEMATAGSLSVSLTDIAASLIHMCANRLLQSATRAQEMVMYSLMSRCYRGQIARNAQSPRRRSKVEEAHA